MVGELQKQISRRTAWRWPVAGLCILLLVALGQLSLSETDEQPTIGVSAARRGGRLVLTHVQPASLAWDAGFRPGATVTMIDGEAVTEEHGPTDVATAQRLQGRTPSGEPLSMSIQSAEQISSQRRLSFLILAAAFVIVGCVIWVLAADRVAASAMLPLAATAAAALVTAIATPFGAAWTLITEFVALHGFGASLVFLFLVFPINRLATRWGRWIAITCVALNAGLVGLYGLALVVDPAWYDLLNPISLAVLVADVVTAVILTLLPLRSAESRHGPTRHALTLLAIGTVGGILPVCLFLFIPGFFEADSPVAPRTASLSLVLLPLSLGAAVLSRQFFGITHLLQRGLLALLVWASLIGLYGAGLMVIAEWYDRRASSPGIDLASAALTIVAVGATFWPLQQYLRQTLERRLFQDTYDYQQTLQQISHEIVQRGNLESIADHVLARIGATLNLDWVAVELDTEAGPNRFYWSRESGSGTDSTQLETNAGYAMPLSVDQEAVGTLVLGPKRREIEPTADDLTLVATLAPLIGAALQNALLARQMATQMMTLAQREQDLAALNAKLIRVQEEERHRLALDLHDDPLQRAILLTRELGEPVSGAQPSRWHRIAEDIVQSLRAICIGLRPATLDDLGLVAGLESLVNNMRASSDLNIALVTESADRTAIDRLDHDLEVALYRAAQEGLNNCYKHAQANQVSVLLQLDDERVTLQVEDDGKGIQQHAATNGHTHRGLGLLGIQERLSPWQGTVTLEPNRPHGCILRAEVAVQRERDDATHRHGSGHYRR